MSDPSSCSSCPSKDSPPSMTTNIIGVLTFVYVMTAGILIRISAVKAARAELGYLRRELQVWNEEGVRFLRDFKLRDNRDPSKDLRALKEKYDKFIELETLLRLSFDHYDHIGVWARHILMGANHEGLIDKAKVRVREIKIRNRDLANDRDLTERWDLKNSLASIDARLEALERRLADSIKPANDFEECN